MAVGKFEGNGRGGLATLILRRRAYRWQLPASYHDCNFTSVVLSAPLLAPAGRHQVRQPPQKTVQICCSGQWKETPLGKRGFLTCRADLPDVVAQKLCHQRRRQFPALIQSKSEDLDGPIGRSALLPGSLRGSWFEESP